MTGMIVGGQAGHLVLGLVGAGLVLLVVGLFAAKGARQRRAPSEAAPQPVAPPPSAPVAPPPVVTPLPAGGLVGPPPGLIAPPPAQTAAATPVAPPPAAPVDPVDEATRRPRGGVHATPPTGERTWVLRPRVGGGEHVLTGSVVIGRDPDATAHGAATPWRVDDPALTVSKTHALVSLVGGSPWIEDLDSTHGVVIRRNGDEATIATRTPTRLLPRDVLVLGTFEIAVDAAG